MERPRILFSASAEGWENYEAALREAGGDPVGGYCPPVDLSCHGLLLCGGEDMDPALFGQADAGSVGVDPARDAAECALVRSFLSAGKPVLGICRGHQVLNVALGGTLVQDLGETRNLFHRRASGSAEDQTHTVCAARDSLLHRLYGPIFSVNSSHHQAVDRLGGGLRATAWSESGVVEALEHPQLPVVGVQFHPERMAYGLRRPGTVDGGLLFTWFLARCGGTS